MMAAYELTPLGKTKAGQIDFVRGPEEAILVVLAEREVPMDAEELASVLKSSEEKMSKVCGGLEKRGLLTALEEPSGNVSRLRRFIRPMPSMSPVGPIDTRYSGNGNGPGAGEKTLGGIGKVAAAMMKGTGKALDGIISVSKKKRRR